MDRDTPSVRVAGVAVLEWDIRVRSHRGRASGDLGYVVGIEHSTVSVGGATPEAYELRVTEVFRREDGEWKVVHRHADPMPDSDAARRQLARLDET
jgi:ketosteroid isomerase-like protein